MLVSGFFISCTSELPLVRIQTDDLSPTEILDKGNRLLADSPESPTGYHYIALGYAGLARNQSPEQRADAYQNMRDAFEQAILLYGRGQESALNDIDTQLRTHWSNEHNSAASLFRSDSTSNSTSDRTQIALAHAQNARIIIPDSVITADLLSDIYIHSGSPAMALETLVSIEQIQPHKSGYLLERIAFLHAFQNDYEQASVWYVKALDWHTRVGLGSLLPQSVPAERGSVLNTYHGAINAFIEAGNTDLAVTHLSALNQAYPDNTLYRQLLSSQYLSKLQMAQYDDMGRPDMTHTPATLARIRGLIDGRTEAMLDTGFELLAVTERYISTLSEIDPDFSPAEDSITMALLSETRYYLQAVRDAGFDSDDILEALAETWYLVGNDAEAIRILGTMND